MIESKWRGRQAGVFEVRENRTLVLAHHLAALDLSGRQKEKPNITCKLMPNALAQRVPTL